MSGQDIQIDVIFSSKSQTAVSQAKSLDDINLVMKPMSSIPSQTEEKSKLMPICNQGEFFRKPKEIKQRLTLEEVS